MGNERATLPQVHIDRLKSLIATKGLLQTARLVGVRHQTLERAIGGLRMQPGSLALLGNAIATRDADGKHP